MVVEVVVAVSIFQSSFLSTSAPALDEGVDGKGGNGLGDMRWRPRVPLSGTLSRSVKHEPCPVALHVQPRLVAVLGRLSPTDGRWSANDVQQSASNK